MKRRKHTNKTMKHIKLYVKEILKRTVMTKMAACMNEIFTKVKERKKQA